RDGLVAGSRPAAEATESWLIESMVGRPLAQLYPRHVRTPGAVVLEVRNLSKPPVLRDASFSVREGEIVALAGLVGSGRSEIARIVFGIDKPRTGEIRLAGRPVRNETAAALADGIALVPEDRGTQGLLPSFSVAETLSLSVLGSISRCGLLAPRAERSLANRLIRQFDVRPSDRSAAAGSLSGGNQQKVLIGRMVAAAPRL